jgi:hypothetical protein
VRHGWSGGPFVELLLLPGVVRAGGDGLGLAGAQAWPWLGLEPFPKIGMFGRVRAVITSSCSRLPHVV